MIKAERGEICINCINYKYLGGIQLSAPGSSQSQTFLRFSISNYFSFRKHIEEIRNNFEVTDIKFPRI